MTVAQSPARSNPNRLPAYTVDCHGHVGRTDVVMLPSYYQVRTYGGPCNRLECATCAPRVKERKLRQVEKALRKNKVVAFYIHYVHASEVDKLRKRGQRAAGGGFGALSVPMSKDWNAYITTQKLTDGAELGNRADLRRILLYERLSKRQVTLVGAWAEPAEPASKKKAPTVWVLDNTGQFTMEDSMRAARIMGVAPSMQEGTLMWAVSSKGISDLYILEAFIRARQERLSRQVAA